MDIFDVEIPVVSYEADETREAWCFEGGNGVRAGRQTKLKYFGSWMWMFIYGNLCSSDAQVKILNRDLFHSLLWEVSICHISNNYIYMCMYTYNVYSVHFYTFTFLINVETFRCVFTMLMDWQWPNDKEGLTFKGVENVFMQRVRKMEYLAGSWTYVIDIITMLMN